MGLSKKPKTMQGVCPDEHVPISTLRLSITPEAAWIEISEHRLPDFNLPLSQRSSAPVVVGSWCCPFMFIKEGKLKDQMKMGKIFASEYNSSDGHSVAVKLLFKEKRLLLPGEKLHLTGGITADGVTWFRSSGDVGGGASVGLSLEIVEGMKNGCFEMISENRFEIGWKNLIYCG
uniref:Uncharacterized protein n=1 Tax=Salix viminalis TaxID=40686 RepID=A0A6N2KD81_SALVM